jgi:hypothetical protein
VLTNLIVNNLERFLDPDCILSPTVSVAARRALASTKTVLGKVAEKSGFAQLAVRPPHLAQFRPSV